MLKIIGAVKLKLGRYFTLPRRDELYKSGLTRALYNQFRTTYQSFHSTENSILEAYVYVDAAGVKLLTDVDMEEGLENQIFALSTTQDGIIEALSLNEKAVSEIVD